MAKDVIARLKADTSQWDSGLSKAGRSMAQFKQQNLSMEGVLNQQVKTLLKVGAQYASYGAAISGAMKVAKDAFMSSEAFIDEWGRTMESVKDVYDGFLTALNTGDISGYLSRIDEIVSAARIAYDELDRLSTQKAINNKAYQEQNVENERMRAMIRTGRYIAPNDGRSTGGWVDGQKLTKEQIEQISKQLQNGLKKTNDIVKSEIAQTNRSIESLYDKQAYKLGVTKQAFKDATSSMDAFDKVLEGYAKYQQYENNRADIAIQTAAGIQHVKDATANPYQQYAWAGVFKDDGELFGKINELINQRAALQSQNYSQQAQAYRTINKAEGTTGGSKTAKTYGIGIDMSGDVAQSIIDGIKMVSPEDAMKDFVEGMKDAIQEGLGKIEPLKITDGSTYDYIGEMRDNVNGIASAFNAASGALGQFAGESEEAAIAAKSFTIAGAIAQLVAQFASIPKGVEIWSWMAGTIAGTGTLIATIASLKSATAEYHAQGGIVGNGPFIPRGSDTVPAMLTPGEVVLNASQQRNIASNLQSNGQAGGVYESITRAEDMVTIINTWGKRTGKGEIMFG